MDISSQDQKRIILYLAAEADTLALSARFAPGLRPGMVVHLHGELGAGKTTFVRGVLRALGYAGHVKSPTFTVVELYTISSLYLYHFDFYRFEDYHELRDAGLDEYFNGASVCLVEWPEKAGQALPSADIDIHLELAGYGRNMVLTANSAIGKQCLAALDH
jgi:tRNA threonylcarbamoyladenosine biosynthesis protein TsaE